MRLVTAREMQRLDRETVEGGTPSLTLMEHAGRRVAEAVTAFLGRPAGKTVTVIAGKGNNGGDGLVAARHLKRRRCRVQVFLLADRKDLRGDARVNLARYERLRGRLYDASRCHQAEAQACLASSDLFVDAIFGTGLSSPVTGPVADVIGLINASGKPVVSVDLPSGVHADTGQIMGTAVQAHLTVTFAPPKQGLYLHPGAGCVGTLRIVEIGIPQALIASLGPGLEVLTDAEVAAMLPPRPPEAHKGTFGHVGVIAGSVGKAGAAALTGVAALRAGAGLVTIAHPCGLETARFAPEIMTHPLPETAAGTLSLQAKAACIAFARDKTVLAIGPGLSDYPETRQLIRELIETLDQPVVLDADGLNALPGRLELLARAKAPLILTPHPGEMARLLNQTTAAVQRDRLGIAREFASRHSVHLVLKGAGTIVAGPAGRLFINPTGNPGMATAGTGDALTGIIAGLVAQGLDPGRAAAAGVYLHGLAGDLARDRRGPRGLLAGDLIEEVPAALDRLAGSASGGGGRA